MEDCPICCLPFTKSVRKEITCLKCEHKACSSCVEQFILGRPDPCCMNCNTPYNNSYILENFKKSFYYGKYKEHFENTLCDKEKARLPEAQAWIDKSAELEEKRELYNDLRKRFIALGQEIAQEQYELNNYRGVGLKKTHFTIFCPYDGCRGILSSRWKCNICENYTCSQCHELKKPGEEHVCNEDNVKSAQAIKKDSKPCPSCGIYIFKIVGCNQMWCTECNTAFDWASGRIINDKIHNPHFFEARRRIGNSIGRDVGDIPCGGMPTKRELYNKVSGDTDDNPRYWCNFPIYLIDLICEFEGLNILTRPTEDNQIRGSITKANIDYLKNDISENSYKSRLFQLEKDRHYNADNANLIQTIITILQDFLRQFVVGELTYENLLGNFCEIVNYYNSQLHNISKSYNRKPSWYMHISKFTIEKFNKFPKKFHYRIFRNISIISASVFTEMQDGFRWENTFTSNKMPKVYTIDDLFLNESEVDNYYEKRNKFFEEERSRSALYRRTGNR